MNEFKGGGKNHAKRSAVECVVGDVIRGLQELCQKNSGRLKFLDDGSELLGEAYAEKMERARAGETVDFYGNGSSFRMWTDANGVEHVKSKGPPHAQHRYTSEERPDNSYKSTFSAKKAWTIEKEADVPAVHQRPASDFEDLKRLQ